MDRLHRSDTWLREHLSTIGSTAAGVIVGGSPYQTPAELYDAMVDAESGVIDASRMNDDMRRGLLTEPLHRQLLEDELGVKVHDHDQDRFIYNPKYPWAHALPDGWILAEDGQEIPVQLKCPRPRAWHEIKLKGLHGHWLIGTMHSLAVTGAPYEHFSVLNVETMRLIQFPVRPDPTTIDTLMALEAKFFADMRARRRPDSTAMPKMELPPINGEMVTIDTAEARDLSRQWIEADALAADAAALKEQVEARVKALMADARVVQLPGARFYHTKMGGRRTLDRTAMERDGIDPKKYEKQGDPYTMFRGYKVDVEKF